MYRRSIFLLLLTLVFIFNLTFLCGAPSTAFAADNVYTRNGEVYVLIGSGNFKGVYANSKIDPASGERAIIPNGIPALFPKTPAGINAVDAYYAIGVDQFRNIYVMSASYDKELTSLGDPLIPNGFYAPVDPPNREGVVGVGKDDSGNGYYDVINNWSGGYGPNHGEARSRQCAKDMYDVGLWPNNNAPYVMPGNISTGYANKYNVSAAQMKRMNTDWYVGRYETFNAGAFNWQRRWDIKIQRVKLWIDFWVKEFPQALAWPASPKAPNCADSNPADDVINSLELAFNTTNISYTYARLSACGDFHGDSRNASPATVVTDARLSFTATSTGRRYTYASLPSPLLKKGTITFVRDATNDIKYGIPNADSAPYSGPMWNSLTANTCGIGAATKDLTDDWVYAAPNEGNILDFTVSDQWDESGGIVYELIQNGGQKTLKWNKFMGLTPGVWSTANLPSDVSCIAADGGGALYYLTDARGQNGYQDIKVTEQLTNVQTFKMDGTTPTNVPVPNGTEDGQPVWSWVKIGIARAATELYSFDYYNPGVAPKRINDFTVGFEKIRFQETFRDAQGTMLKSRSVPTVIDDPPQWPKVENIKLDVATINLSGPPTGNNERNCVDIFATSASRRNITDVKFNIPEVSGGRPEEIALNPPNDPANAQPLYQPSVDEVEEDKVYAARMENAPPVFSNDNVKKNTKSGMQLSDENGNKITGGFLYSTIPDTIKYYWHVDMIEPMKKSVSSTIISPGTTVKADNANIPTNIPAGTKLAGVNFNDGTWRVSTDQNDPEFKFRPTEPGIYKISMVVSSKFYRYETMSYPTSFQDRPNYISNVEYLLFDDGRGGGVRGDGIKNGTEDYVCERYVVVTEQKTKSEGYISDINITGPQKIDENQAGTWTAEFKVKFARSINHEKVDKQDPSNIKKIPTETFDGIGVWDYPTNVVNDWGLPPQPQNNGEDYVIGARWHPSNYISTGQNANTLEVRLRNFGEVPPESSVIADPMPEYAPDAGAGNAKKWGYKPNAGERPSVLWIEGAGTQTNPEKPINLADRGAIEYEWYLAAEQVKNDNTRAYFDKTADGEPGILIAKGRLSDEVPFPGTTKNVVEWSPNSYISSSRLYTVKVNLRYAFDMPLTPGKYYLYIKLYYPIIKWSGKYSEITKTNVKESSFYDLVDGGRAETKIKYNDPNSNAQKSDYTGGLSYTPGANSPPFGYAIIVDDKQSPQAYFQGNDPNFTNPAINAPLNAIAPTPGVPFKGATTGDPYPEAISCIVCDNNPNTGLADVTVRAKAGIKKTSLAWKNLPTREAEDVQKNFTSNAVRTVLAKTIAPYPNVGQKASGFIYDVTTETLVMNKNSYPGYGVDAPFRQGTYFVDPQVPNGQSAPLNGNDIPYDMTGSIPLYVDGTDGESPGQGILMPAGSNKNTIGDANCDGNISEIVMDPDPNTIKNNHLEFKNSPAYISIIDNDSPTLIFRALLTRDNTSRRYIIGSPVLDGVNLAATPGETGTPDDPSFHDVLNWDPSVSGKLKFDMAHMGLAKVMVQNMQLDESLLNTLFAPAQIPVGFTAGAMYRQFTNANISNTEDIFAVGDSFEIGFNGKNISLGKTYNDYSPVSVAYYDFDSILNGNNLTNTMLADTLEITEDTRTRFELVFYDNVDRFFNPARYTGTGGLPEGAVYYIDTKNLGEEESLKSVLGGWSSGNAKLTDANGANPKTFPSQATYGIFRDPTPLTNPKPYMFMLVKDNSGNVTAVRLPIAILHTLLKTNVLNVEQRRSQ